MLAALTADERSAVEAATGKIGNEPDAVKGWLEMRTTASWTKNRYTITVGGAFDKLRRIASRSDEEGRG